MFVLFLIISFILISIAGTHIPADLLPFKLDLLVRLVLSATVSGILTLGNKK